jgi:predicted DNA-binding protein (UPF0251 family)/predicted Fe-Mo cluster-binding NifX family protein
MPRPQKCRRVCREPEYTCFMPEGIRDGQDAMLTVDEYEVLKLVDYQRRTHEQCAAQMDISRTTVTEIYENARYKVADALVNGKRIVIGGGRYRLCDGSALASCGAACHRRGEMAAEMSVTTKGEGIMRIAVTYENGKIFQHFGHTAQFKLYDIEDGKIVTSIVVDTNGSGHGALAGLLASGGVDALICGGIGGGAQMALANAGITLYGGVQGDADEAVQAFIEGRLGYNPDVHCDHHDHGEHNCGEHGCGEHGCGGSSCH